MVCPYEGGEKRRYRRLYISLPIMLFNKRVESKNISSTGVYFESLVENSEIFQLGKSVDFEIIAKTSSPMLPSRTIRLGGSGKIIRNATVENIEAERKCGVAIKFHKKLDILLNL